MLNEERPLASLIRAGELGVLRNLYPPLGDASHLESLSEGFGIPGPLFLLAALAFPLSPPQGEDFNARLNMPRRWATTVRDTISLREAQNALETPNLNNVDLCQLLEGHSVDALTALGALTSSPKLNQRLVLFMDKLRYVKSLLRGPDLTALGVPAGTLVGKVLSKLKDARLESRVVSRKDEVNMVKKLMDKGEASLWKT